VSVAAMPAALRGWAESVLGAAAAERIATMGERLFELLSEANARVNLTRIDSPEGFWSKHVADSLLLLQLFPELARRRLAVADIGCGAGFPSLVLAIVCPEWEICAIDSIGKKVAFVHAAAEALKLTNLEPVHGRSRELDCKAEYQRRFDLVTARAVAATAVLAADTRRFLRPGGRYLFYKTPGQLDEEWSALCADPVVGRWGWKRSVAVPLPGSDASRQFVFAFR